MAIELVALPLQGEATPKVAILYMLYGPASARWPRCEAAKRPNNEKHGATLRRYELGRMRDGFIA